jgi:hypothetical protein
MTTGMKVLKSEFVSVCVVLLLLCVAAVPHAFAQQGFGKVSGTVTDTKSAVVTKAKVTVTSKETGVKSEGTTSGAGLYVVTDLIPGNYIVQIVKDGFHEEVIDGVVVQADVTTTVDAKLTIGAVNMSVTVKAEGQLIDKTTAAVSVTMDKDLLQNLPYMERSSLGAIMLAPEVVGNPEDAEGIDTENPGIYTGYVAPGATIGVGGATPGRTSIIVDGSDVTQASLPRAGITVSGDFVSETTVFSAGTPAQYGRTMGGAVAQSTRSGSSQYHGALTWRYADSFLEANNWGSTFPTDIHDNLFGIYAGGPVRIPKLYDGREKTFFYVAVEPARLKTYSYNNGTTPLDSELQGQFYNSLSFLNTTTLKTSGYAAALAAPRTGGLWYQFPLNAQGFPYGKQLTTAQYTAIPNDDVSAQTALNPLSQFIASNFPTTTNPGPFVHYYNPQNGYWNQSAYNVQFLRASFNFDNRWSFRVDHAISAQDHVFVRFSDVPLTQERLFALAPTNPIQASPADDAHSYNWAVNETHIFSSSVVNTAKALFLQDKQSRLPDPSDLTQDYAAKFGFPPSAAGVGFPDISLGYSLGLGYNAYNLQTDQNYQLGDDLTWTKGKHVIGMGLDLRLLRSKQADVSGLYGGTIGTTGETSNGGVGGNNLAQLDLGLISSYSATGIEVPVYYFWHYYGGYFQDSYRIRSNLTLSLGLRYEIETPRAEKYNHQGTFIPNYEANLLGTPVEGAFCFSGQCGLSRSLWPTNYHGFEPRVGAIFSPQENVTFQLGLGLMKSPLSGYGNIPSPSYNASTNSVGATSGGVTATYGTDFITNPIAPLTTTQTFFGLNPVSPYAYAPSNISAAFTNQSKAVPYSISWDFAMQMQVARGTVIKMGYTGLRGIHTISNYAPPLNLPPLASVINLLTNPAAQVYNNLGTTISTNTYGITNNYPTNTGAPLTETWLQKLDPYQNFWTSALQESFNRKGLMLYNGGYVSVSHTVGLGLSLQGSYTWSKNLDNVGADSVASGLTGPGGSTRQNPYQKDGDWSLSTTDVPSRLGLGFTEQIPIGKNQLIPISNRFLDPIVSGFYFGAVISAQSGWPSAMLLGGTGWWDQIAPGPGYQTGKTGAYYVSNGTAVPTGAQLRPDVVPGTSCMSGLDWKGNLLTTPYLNAAHFSMPGGADTAGTYTVGTPAFGDAPRTEGECRSPHVFQFNANAGKRIPLGGVKSLQLGITASDVLNHPVYVSTSNNHTLYGGLNSAWLTNPITPATGSSPAVANQPFLPSSSFGLISTGNVQTRVVQLNARFTF